MQQLKPGFFQMLFSSRLLLVILLLSSCGGGGGGSGNQSFVNNLASSSAAPDVGANISASSNSLSSTTSAVSSSLGVDSGGKVTLSGKVTYDYVPHNLNHVGLDYSATQSRPVRGALVEMLDQGGQPIASGATDNTGSYLLTVTKNTLVKIRVKAELFRNTSPSWDFKVTDNTAANALYVLDGALITSGSQNSTRNLHAGSGWDGTGYSATRAAAPFAILDNVYTAVERTLAAGNKTDFRPLELRWSTKNSAADGDLSLGEIGTSFYYGSSIYILGDANNDTDEYDPHVLLHEWGHYLEDEVFRSDSIGGNHSDGEFLDLRVAMSEGFANAFSGMMIDDVNYADASGRNQASGFSFNIARKTRTNKGFFSEGSVGSVLFNYYLSAVNKTASDFTPIFSILSSPTYIGSEAFTSIFLFFDRLKKQFPEHTSVFSSLLAEQAIYGTDEFANSESNNGGLAIVLPVYKIVTPDNAAVNICSTNHYGVQNKLGNSQFLKLQVNQAGAYSIRVAKNGGANLSSKPEIIVHRLGKPIVYAPNRVIDNINAILNAVSGTYIIEIYDYNNYVTTANENLTCFDVRVAISP